MLYYLTNKEDFDKIVKEIIENRGKNLKEIEEKAEKKENGIEEKVKFGEESLSNLYEREALYNHLIEKDIKKYRENMYLSAKLYIMEQREKNFYDRSGYMRIFPFIMSNSKELLKFLTEKSETILYNKFFDKKHILSDSSFMNKSIIMALKGDFEQLKIRSEKFLKNPPFEYLERRIDNEFLLALSEKNIENMKKVINRMSKEKIAKTMMSEVYLGSNFYLHPQILVYAKIAMRHGIDLGIDSEIAPLDLIDNTPLESYTEPYEFIRKFNLDDF